MFFRIREIFFPFWSTICVVVVHLFDREKNLTIFSGCWLSMENMCFVHVHMMDTRCVTTYHRPQKNIHVIWYGYDVDDSFCLFFTHSLTINIIYARYPAWWWWWFHFSDRLIYRFFVVNFWIVFSFPRCLQMNKTIMILMNGLYIARVFVLCFQCMNELHACMFHFKNKKFHFGIRFIVVVFDVKRLRWSWWKS